MSAWWFGGCKRMIAHTLTATNMDNICTSLSEFVQTLTIPFRFLPRITNADFSFIGEASLHVNMGVWEVQKNDRTYLMWIVSMQVWASMCKCLPLLSDFLHEWLFQVSLLNSLAKQTCTLAWWFGVQKNDRTYPIGYKCGQSLCKFDQVNPVLAVSFRFLPRIANGEQ